MILPDSHQFVPASHAECEALANAAGMTLPSSGPGFFWAWGGKLAWLALIAFLIKVMRDSARKRRELEHRQAERRAARRVKHSR